MKTKVTHKVSVVICTYNGEKYLHEQLDTILAQTYPVYEIIIQDDHSTDETWSILQVYKQNNPAMKIFFNEGNKGINHNFFSAIARASGDYIVLSDQDDIWEPDKIEKQIAIIGDALLCAGISCPFAEGVNTNVHYDARIPNLNLERIIYISMVAGHTLMLRKELMDKIPNYRYWSEYFLYDHLLQIVASSFNSLVFCPSILVHQRRHISSATYTEPYSYKKSLGNILRSVIRTYKNYRIIQPQMKVYFSHIYALLNEIHYSSWEMKNARSLAKYHSSGNFLDYFKLSFLCVKLRDRIFHTKEKDSLFLIGRALYFQISCSDYFRYMKKVDR